MRLGAPLVACTGHGDPEPSAWRATEMYLELRHLACSCVLDHTRGFVDFELDLELATLAVEHEVRVHEAREPKV